MKKFLEILIKDILGFFVLTIILGSLSLFKLPDIVLGTVYFITLIGLFIFNSKHYIKLKKYCTACVKIIGVLLVVLMIGATTGLIETETPTKDTTVALNENQQVQNDEDTSSQVEQQNEQEQTMATEEEQTQEQSSTEQEEAASDQQVSTQAADVPSPQTATQSTGTTQNTPSSNIDQFAGYTRVDIESCSLSGNRQSNAVVDIGYGDREYWAFTNEHGQLVKVTADKITLQNDATENTTNGRYCSDEAKVPGTERSDLDEGHVIADSLGGVSNAYNITPQNSTVNRHGEQSEMESEIRNAGGCTDFVALITYDSTNTQIPSSYKYTYKINGKTVTREFKNTANTSSSSNSSSSTTTNNNKNNSVSSNGSSSAGNSSSSNNSNTTTKPNNSNTTTNQVPQEQKVWLSATGEKYHSKNNCGKMNPDKAKQVTLSEAKSQGKEACNKCY